MDEFELLEGQIAVVQKEQKAAFFKQNVFNAKLGRHHALFYHYRNACNEVARRLCDGVVRLKAARVATAGKPENEVNDFIRGLVL